MIENANDKIKMEENCFFVAVTEKMKRLKFQSVFVWSKSKKCNCYKWTMALTVFTRIHTIKYYGEAKIMLRNKKEKLDSRESLKWTN